MQDGNKKSKGIQHPLEIEINWYDGGEQRGALEMG
jgi:hypothetical protein